MINGTGNESTQVTAMNIYQNNYQKILHVIPGLFELEECVKLLAPGAKT